jgi:hypothetical protein
MDKGFQENALNLSIFETSNLARLLDTYKKSYLFSLTQAHLACFHGQPDGAAARQSFPIAVHVEARGAAGCCTALPSKSTTWTKLNRSWRDSTHGKSLLAPRATYVDD